MAVTAIEAISASERERVCWALTEILKARARITAPEISIDILNFFISIGFMGYKPVESVRDEKVTRITEYI
ncbi:hypothetical protein MASR1M74_01470 [Lentimicrobium sp.]